MKATIQTKFLPQSEVQIKWGKYPHNGRVACVIQDQYGRQEMVASVNMVDHVCPDGYMYVKNYSENEGVMQELQRLELIELDGVPQRAGHTVVWLCKLTEKALEDMKDPANQV